MVTNGQNWEVQNVESSAQYRPCLAYGNSTGMLPIILWYGLGRRLENSV